MSMARAAAPHQTQKRTTAIAMNHLAKIQTDPMLIPHQARQLKDMVAARKL